jgi:hypothetical protein
MKHVIRYSALLSALAVILVGCSVNPKTHEKSGPSVVFRERDNNISALYLSPSAATAPTAAIFAPEPLACVAKDPGGVQSISLSFTQTVDLCVFPGGCGSSFCIGDDATFHISPALPAEQTATSHPDSSGQVPNELFLSSTLEGAYLCTASKDGRTATGEPYGQSIKATCTAANYSMKSTTVTIPVTFNPPASAACCTGSSCQCNNTSKAVLVVCCPNTTCHSDNSCH